MKGQIFLMHDNNELHEMEETLYDSEDLLQHLLEKYPKLLAGNQINQTEPCRWLLIKREMNVPDSEMGNGRWSLDHLFVDQNGIPTLVEVKRSTDTRNRREVVAQMLDYAANSVRYWDGDTIIAEYENRCRENDRDSNDFLLEFLKNNEETETFWQTVTANLRQGKIRMLFVADVIPPELQRIVEFLNEQMSPAEVLAVEIKQYTGHGKKAMVSRVVGKTMKAVDAKSVGAERKRHWTREELISQVAGCEEPGLAEVYDKVLEWAETHGYTISYQGLKYANAKVQIRLANGKSVTCFRFYGYGSFTISFDQLRMYSPYNNLQMRKDLIQKLNQDLGFSFTDDKTDTWSWSEASPLKNDTTFNQFCLILEEIRDNLLKNHQ